MALKSRNGTVQSSNFQPFCTAVHGNPLYPKDPVRDFHRPIAMNALKLASRRNNSRACPSLLVTLQKAPDLHRFAVLRLKSIGRKIDYVEY